MRLTEANIKKLQAPERGNSITYDDEIPGGLRVTAANARAFVLGYSINGRKRRMSIGRWPVWTATAARARAKQLRRMIDLGQDPLGKRQARRGEPTFAQIAAEYLKRHAARKKSGYRDEAWLRKDVLPEWGPLKASDLRRRDVIRLIEEKAETAPIAANRLLALIRTVFNFAIDRAGQAARQGGEARSSAQRRGDSRFLAGLGRGQDGAGDAYLAAHDPDHGAAPRRGDDGRVGGVRLGVGLVEDPQRAVQERAGASRAALVFGAGAA